VALGASRGRLIRQFLTECAMLAILGGIAGVGLGAWIGRLLTIIRLPGDLPVRLDFHLDGRVLAYALALTTATPLLVGLIAARRGPHRNVDEALHDHRHGSTSIMGGYAIRKALLVAQIAICFMLLVAGGLFLRSLAQAEHANFGFRPEGVLNVQMDVAQVGYTPSRGRAFFDEVQRRVARVAGVEDVAFGFSVPLGYVRLSSRIDVEDYPLIPGERTISGKNIVSPHYFASMGIPIERGRDFTGADDERSRPVTVVNRHLAALLSKTVGNSPFWTR